MRLPLLLSLALLSAASLRAQSDYDEAPRFGQGCAYCLRNLPHAPQTAEANNINNNDRSDTLDILHYTITLDITDFSTKIIRGNCALQFSPKLNNVASIALDLQTFTIDSITLDGQLVSNYNYNDTLLRVPFPAPLNDSDTADLVVHYHGVPSQDASWGGFYYDQGYAYSIGVGFSANPHTVGRFWYPCFDNFAERATYTFHITTPDTKRAHCNGYLAGEALLGNRLTRTWEMEQPIPTYLSCVAVQNYATVHDSHNGIPIELVAMPADTTNLKNSFVNLGTAIDAFEYWYGGHQWNKVGYTVVPFPAGAMEHASNIFYPKFAVNGNLTYEGLMAHELCHSWWGNLATCETAEDMWINEGMATYGEYLFAERQYGWNRYIADMKDLFYGVMREAHIEENGYRPISGIPHEYTYGQHVYLKGAAVAHNLRWYLGDALYRQGMSAVLANHYFNNLNSVEMRDELIANTGVDLTSFFDDWVFAGGFPHFELDKVTYEPTPAMEYEAKLHIQQKLRGAPHFHTNVPLQVSFWDENWNHHVARIEVSGELDSASISVPFLPTTVIINEEHRLNQAREDKSAMLYQTGGNALLTNLQITAIGDSAYLWHEHHLVAPDPSIYPSHELSTTHYWTINGVFPDTFHATARINVDAIWDADLQAVYGNDSLQLFYRPSPDAQWQLHPDYTKVEFFTLTYFNIHDLLPGDYAIGNYYNSLSNTSQPQPAWASSLRLYPNPVQEYLTLEWSAAQASDWQVHLYDALGRTVAQAQWTCSAGAQQQTLVLPALPQGIYWLRLQDADGNVEHRAVQR